MKDSAPPVPDSLPPVVFLPGLCEPASLWHPLRERLGLGARDSLAVDLPGHGPAQDVAEVVQDLSGGNWLDRLAERLERRFDGRPVMVVGHSTGGMLSLSLAARHPERVRSVALIGALTDGVRDLTVSPLRRTMTEGQMGPSAYVALWRFCISTPSVFRFILSHSARCQLDLPQAERMRADLRQCNPHAVLACARWVLRSSVSAELPRVLAPILSLVGAQDPVVRPERQLRMLRTAPNAHAQVFEGGHLLFAENPGRVAQALTAWRALAPSVLPAPATEPPIRCDTTDTLAS